VQREEETLFPPSSKGGIMKLGTLIMAAVIASIPVAASAGANAAPSAGASPSDVPEPSDLALFALGVAGLIIGRQSIRNRRR